MTQEFKLGQLYRTHDEEFCRGTVWFHDTESEERFNCKIQGDTSHNMQLWQWVGGHWSGKDGIPCTVEFNDVTESGHPKDGVIINIKGFTVLTTPKPPIS